MAPASPQRGTMTQLPRTDTAARCTTRELGALLRSKNAKGKTRRETPIAEKRTPVRIDIHCKLQNLLFLLGPLNPKDIKKELSYSVTPHTLTTYPISPPT